MDLVYRINERQGLIVNGPGAGTTINVVNWARFIKLQGDLYRATWPDEGAYFTARFGWPTSYFRLNGQEYSSFTSIPGATSTGGAGFGMVQRNGVWQSVDANAPLIGDGGLGVWEARTNSQRVPKVGLPTWVGTNIVEGDPIPSPAGGSVKKRIRTTSPLLHYSVADGPAITYEAGQTYTWEIFAKDGGDGVIIFEPPSGTAFPGGALHYTFATGAFNNIANFPIRGAISLTGEWEGWVKIYISRVAVAATSVRPFPNIHHANYGNSTGDGVSGLYYDGAQAKLGPYINDSPILQTSGLPATRTAVAQNVAGLNLPPVGFIYAEWVQPIIQTTTRTYVLNVNDTTNSRLSFRASGGGGDSFISLAIGDGAGISNLVVAAPAAGTVNRAVFAYDTTSARAALAFNGGDQTTARQLAASTIANATIALGQGGSGANALNERLRRLRIVPGWPSEAERIAMTSA